MGFFIGVILVGFELYFLMWSRRTACTHRRPQALAAIGLTVLFGLFILLGAVTWSFRYALLLVVLVLRAASGLIRLNRPKEREYQPLRDGINCAVQCLVILGAVLPLILFPPYAQPTVTGTYEVATSKYTWVDPSRIDEFSDVDQNRALTVEFWYPQTAGGSYPLVIFSHGAFGFSGSNYSTCAELASNGYVVASIGHTYQAFYTMDTNNKLTLADSDFLEKATEINAVHDTRNKRDIYNITKEWMKLRIDDENFVINTILNPPADSYGGTVFSLIDAENIGLFGHSLGGATSAQVGRERSDIDAVIILDGTMLGEEIGFENNSVRLNESPYPVPLLNIYAEDHYANAQKYVGDTYNNFHATKNAQYAYETVFRGAGHLNFTDLPLFSPVLARMLGVGDIDPRDCIVTMNQVVLNFFDSYLKNGGRPRIEKEY